MKNFDFVKKIAMGAFIGAMLIGTIRVQVNADEVKNHEIKVAAIEENELKGATQEKLMRVSKQNIKIEKSGKITIDFSKKGKLYAKITKGSDVVSVTFGKRKDGKTPMKFTGLKNGKATIVLTNGVNDEKITLHVTVSGMPEQKATVFAVSKEKLTLGTETKAITISYNYKGVPDAVISNRKIASIQWGDWNEDQTKITLYVTPEQDGMKEGGTTTLTISSADGKYSQTVKIIVKAS